MSPSHGNMESLVVEAFKFDLNKKTLEVLDQTLLPKSISYVYVKDTEDGYSVIKSMKVRGAPCIAAVGCLSLIVELNNIADSTSLVNVTTLIDLIKSKSEHLIESRPTAVNLRNALHQVREQCEQLASMTTDGKEFIKRLTDYCQRGIAGGKELNKRLGDYGANEVMKVSDSGKNGKLNVLTHCNTGSLATVGYGTALGVIRSLHTKGALNRAYCTETRPYNQGSRLTAWELVTERMPATLIADSMVAYLMANHKIDAVLVGADCVAANGDTANKIGTLQIALTAKHFGVPFYVAAPTQSIDLTVASQVGIEIEQRPAEELRCIGNIELAPCEVDVWNPCFDVTPANLIAGIITEFGVCATGEVENFVNKVKMSIKMSYEEDYVIF